MLLFQWLAKSEPEKVSRTAGESRNLRFRQDFQAIGGCHLDPSGESGLELVPPLLRERVFLEPGDALKQVGDALGIASEILDGEPDTNEPTLAALIEQGEQAIARSDFITAKDLFGAALQLSKGRAGGEITTMRDPYLLRRLVTATYEAGQPDEVSALNEALRTLTPLSPEESNDPETVVLAGAIEKRLFDQEQGVEHLVRAIRYYGRSYYLQNGWYNGINLAYLLHLRADTPLDVREQEQVADLVWANRIRREVIALCDQDLRDIAERERRAPAQADEIHREQTTWDQETRFWCLATKAEAYFGLREIEAYRRTRSEAEALGHAARMISTLDAQINRLTYLLQKNGHLLYSLRNQPDFLLHLSKFLAFTTTVWRSLQPLENESYSLAMHAADLFADPFTFREHKVNSLENGWRNYKRAMEIVVGKTYRLLMSQEFAEVDFSFEFMLMHQENSRFTERIKRARLFFSIIKADLSAIPNQVDEIEEIYNGLKTQLNSERYEGVQDLYLRLNNNRRIIQRCTDQTHAMAMNIISILAEA